jgi:hypothetical protein
MAMITNDELRSVLALVRSAEARAILDVIRLECELLKIQAALDKARAAAAARTDEREEAERIIYGAVNQTNENRAEPSTAEIRTATDYEVNPLPVPGTHGRMHSKSEFGVFELVPHPNDPALKKTGPRRFVGTRIECDSWIASQQTGASNG